MSKTTTLFIIFINFFVFSLSVVVPFLGNTPHTCVTVIDHYNFEIHEKGEEIIVKTPTGEIVVQPCVGETVGAKHGAAWKAWAQYYDNATITRLYGEWEVPQDPPRASAQTLFYWNGVEPQDTSAVLQPVLQYGSSAAGGGKYWAIASWYVSSHGTIVGKLVPVKTGDKILGLLEVDKTGVWTVNATSTESKASAAIRYTPAANQKFSIAYEVLEAYSITTCDQYPTVGAVDFKEITVEAGGKSVVPKWDAQTQNPITCKEHAEVVSPSEVKIVF